MDNDHTDAAPLERSFGAVPGDSLKAAEEYIS